MDPSVHEVLHGWDSFYVILGSAAAALTGLMFIVITLVAESERPSSKATVAAFGSPTLVHFIAPLILAALLSVPWPKLEQLAVALFAAGGCGVVYSVIAIILERRQAEYRPVLSDWIWFSALPLAAFTALALVAFFVVSAPTPSLFGVAGVSLSLLLVAIHNAWDTVTYLALVREIDRESSERDEAGRK